MNYGNEMVRIIVHQVTILPESQIVSVTCLQVERIGMFFCWGGCSILILLVYVSGRQCICGCLSGFSSVFRKLEYGAGLHWERWEVTAVPVLSPERLTVASSTAHSSSLYHGQVVVNDNFIWLHGLLEVKKKKEYFTGYMVKTSRKPFQYILCLMSTLSQGWITYKARFFFLHVRD